LVFTFFLLIFHHFGAFFVSFPHSFFPFRRFSDKTGRRRGPHSSASESDAAESVSLNSAKAASGVQHDDVSEFQSLGKGSDVECRGPLTLNRFEAFDSLGWKENRTCAVAIFSREKNKKELARLSHVGHEDEERRL
jgi:hypothetical protein